MTSGSKDEAGIIANRRLPALPGGCHRRQGTAPMPPLLFDAMPPRDRSAVVYTFYDLSWFDTVGRQLFVQYSRRFGAAAP